MSLNLVQTNQIIDASNNNLSNVLIGLSNQIAYNNLISNTLVTTQNNWSPTGINSNTNLIILFPNNAICNVTGISNVNVTVGVPILLYNSSNANTVVFLNQNTYSTTGNQLFCPGNTSVQLGPQFSVFVILINTSPIPSWIFK